MMTGRGYVQRETETIFAVLALQSILPFPHDFFVQRVMMKHKAHLPLPAYLARLSYLTFLLTTSSLFLPRSSSVIKSASTSTQLSSADRPEHPFLTPLTANPPLTMKWTILGNIIIMIWWGGQLSTWWTGSEQGEKRLVDDRELSSRQGRVRKTISVSSAFL